MSGPLPQCLPYMGQFVTGALIGWGSSALLQGTDALWEWELVGDLQVQRLRI